MNSHGRPLQMHFLGDHPSASKQLLGAYSEAGSVLRAQNPVMDRGEKGKKKSHLNEVYIPGRGNRPEKPNNNNIVILKANCNSKESPNQEDMEMRELAKKLCVEQQMKKLEHSP